MKNTFFLTIWILIFGVLGFEYWQLHHAPTQSLLTLLQATGKIPTSFVISSDPGRSLGLTLGFLGFGTILLTNLYIFRKRMGIMQNLGKLTNWFNFHIFCGLLGPTFILFHCNFKVRGLVAISFWSMVVSMASGIVGRYAYGQVAKKNTEYGKESEFFLERFRNILTKKNINLPESELNSYLVRAQAMVGAHEESVNPISAFFASLAGDIRLMFLSVPAPAAAGKRASLTLKFYAINYRKAQTVESFQKLMGYWHAFHMPFAVFMYLAAVFHIAAALIFGV